MGDIGNTRSPMDLDGALKELGAVLEEHRLSEARWETPEWGLVLRRRVAPAASSETPAAIAATEGGFDDEPEAAVAPVSQGTPVSSPMTGVFYGASSPSSPPFVKEGDAVTAGTVVGLIEAMKVFNEIVAPTSGTVLKIVAESGAVVNPGEPLLYIG
ncbi:acetyl-CoA carboxylase biotin carboxyl carrier protein [bacterium]|nr:MAG: acetyl-CoA carboxylase biotin carboxyl carrier protein [bacterium]